MSTPESLATASIIQSLQQLGFTVKKIHNGGTPARVFGSKIIYKKKSDDYKGIPDLVAYNLKRGQFFFIEVKRPESTNLLTGKKKKQGRVKPEQAEFIKAFNSCKTYKAVVMRTTEDVIKEVLL